jgi:hypothetical protein
VTRVLTAFIAEHGGAALVAEAMAMALAVVLAIYATAEAIHFAGLNPFDVAAAAAVPAPSELAVDGSGLGAGR